MNTHKPDCDVNDRPPEFILGTNPHHTPQFVVSQRQREGAYWRELAWFWKREDAEKYVVFKRGQFAAAEKCAEMRECLLRLKNCLEVLGWDKWRDGMKHEYFGYLLNALEK